MASSSDRFAVTSRFAAVIVVIVIVVLCFRSCSHDGKTTTTTARPLVATSSPRVKYAPQPTLPSGRVFTITPPSSTSLQPSATPPSTVAPVAVAVDPGVAAAVGAFIPAYANYRYDQPANTTLGRLTGCNCVTPGFLSAYGPVLAAADSPTQNAKNSANQLVVTATAPASSDLTVTVDGATATVRVTFLERVAQAGVSDNARYLTYQLQLTAVNGWRVSAIPQSG